ncbi:MAG: delta-lactam-biosynthetic de-N-acetylase [Eubacterium sp.]
MKIYLKILSCVFSALLLCSCTVKVESPETTKNNTTSNITESTTEAQTTTQPVADPVASISDMSTEKVVWGPGNITDHQQPADPVSLQDNFADLDARWLLSDEKSICLTFDEGYENGFTPTILDTLKEKKVSAVFFVTYDFAKENPDLIKRMIDEGHIVGNHTYRHYTMDEQSQDVQREEVTYLHNYIKDNFNYTMSYFRFPKGEFSEQSLGVVRELGYKSVFWSYAYADWDPESQPNADEALQNICESTHPGEIMLLHAVSQTNADILAAVIDDVRQQGYTFTVDL